MICDDFKSVSELYALGVLEGEEKEQLDAHLGSGCETCREQLVHAQALNAMLMATAVPDLAPPARLKRRILASVGVSAPGWTWAAALAAACMLVVALWLADQERNRGRELAQTRAEVLQVSGDRDRLLQALSFLNDPDTRAVGFAKGPRGNVFLNPNRGIVLMSSNLPKLAAGKALEMWVIPKSGSPRPAGVFAPNADGTALHVLPGAIDVSSIGAVAVTIEPETGSPGPTSTPIIAAGVSP